MACQTCGRGEHGGRALQLDLELEGYELAPRPTQSAGVLASYREEPWDPLALAALPVYAASLPDWWGPSYSVRLWRTPVMWPEQGLRWMVGRRDLSGSTWWTVAVYGGCTVWGPEGLSPVARAEVAP